MLIKLIKRLGNELLNQNLKNRLIGLFVTQETLQENPYEAFRILLVAGMLATITVVTAVFAVFHYVHTENTANMALNLVTSGLLVSLLGFLHHKKAVHLVGHIVIMALMFFPVFVVINQATEFTLAWLFVPPLILIPILGRAWGVFYIGLLYTILFSLSYVNVGVWDNGNWSVLSHIRLMIAILLILALVLVLERANTGLNEKVQQQRKKEHDQTLELQRISSVDALTQVYNRHHFNEVVKKKYLELKNQDQFITFFILDVDHFKLYNDEFGHQKGDEVLYQVAQCIRQFLKRHNDLVFRLGGEEFGGIIVSDKPNVAAAKLKPIQKAVADLKIVHASSAPEEFITVSMGIYSAKLNSPKAMEKIYSKADEALYEAKHRGRNQVCIA